ncbi:50S ribosomal protein L13 [Bacteriovoracales bacterium]|nr:50S ribosomal protein L13 [Bacteriovoracales bacterium]
MYVQKSFVLKPSEAEKKWYLVDADGKTVGRLATEIANLLRGKGKATYTPNTDSGDFVVVINAEKVHFSGKKWDDKKYYRHSGYVGELKVRTAKEQLQRNPDFILMNAVKGMLPKTTLGRKQLTKLKVFTGDKHGHEAQKPQVYEVK